MSQTKAQLINGKSATIEFTGGSASAPAVSFTGDTNTGIYSPGADQVAISTNGTGRLFVNSSGSVGIGTSDVKGALGLQHGNTSPQGLTDIAIDALRINQGVGGSVAIRATQYDSVNQPAAGDTQFFNLFYNGSSYNWYERMRITAAGRVGIGTKTPSVALSLIDDTVSGSNSARPSPVFAIGAQGWNTSLGSSEYRFELNSAPNYGASVFGQVVPDLRFNAVGTNGVSYERARIDSSGRLLVGTSSAGGTELIQVQGTSSGSNLPGGIALRRSSIGNGDDIGYVNFTNASGNIHAGIRAFADGTPGSGDYPGGLIFSTTPDGASSPTERMRIPNGGGLSVGTTVSPSAVNQQTAIRIGALNISQTTITNLSTTWTDITVAAGANGLAFIDVFNASSGSQGNFLVSWRGFPANATVISSSNGTGLTINFQVSSGKLQMQTTSGSVSGGAYVWAG